MYTLAGRLQRDDLEAISARCYLELLRGGYTQVAEFLYLHRSAGAPAGCGLAIAAAARRTGIGLTLLATLYQHAILAAVPPRPGQLPFVRTRRCFSRTGRHCAGATRGVTRSSWASRSTALRAVDIDVIASVVQASRMTRSALLRSAGDARMSDTGSANALVFPGAPAPRWHTSIPRHAGCGTRRPARSGHSRVAPAQCLPVLEKQRRAAHKRQLTGAAERRQKSACW